ncbi:MAG: YicC/YloC family endoribonuclease, partial [Rhodoplanes sp.]
MALSSMTGFARSHGASGQYAFVWEIKSVNAKGLDLRLRLPPGWDAIEQPARAKAVELLARGTVYATLAIERPAVQPIVRINDQVLAAVLATLEGLSTRIQAEAPRLDGILAIKGVVEVIEADESEEDRAAAEAAVVGGFAAALAELAAMRRHEGEALG